MCAGKRVVQLDRRKNLLIDEAAVEAKFGVPPGSIPDYLALVGDSADGFPGLSGWGAKSAGAVLARWLHLEDIPADPDAWEVTVRGAPKLATTLREDFDNAVLFKDLATLRVDRCVTRGRRRACNGSGRPMSSPTCASASTPGRSTSESTHSATERAC